MVAGPPGRQPATDFTGRELQVAQLTAMLSHDDDDDGVGVPIAVIAGLPGSGLANARLPREPYFPPPGPALSPAVVAESLAGSITADPVAWFTAERLSLLAVIERCCGGGRHQAAARLAASMASFQHLQGRPDDAERAWRVIAEAAARAGDPAAAARARLRLAVAACDQGRHAEASPIVDQCVTTFGELADQRALATAWYWRTSCEVNRGSMTRPGDPQVVPCNSPRTPAMARPRSWSCACWPWRR